MGLFDFFKRRSQRESALGDGSSVSVGAPSQDVTSFSVESAPTVVSQSSQTIDASNVAGLRDSMFEVLRRHGIDPESGQSMSIDASQMPGLAEEIQRTLSSHGVQIPDASWAPQGTSGFMQMSQPPDGVDTEERLRKLTELLQSGLISQAEFEQQRARVLGTG
jgi:hypothetical protein